MATQPSLIEPTLDGSGEDPAADGDALLLIDRDGRLSWERRSPAATSEEVAEPGELSAALDLDAIDYLLGLIESADGGGADPRSRSVRRALLARREMLDRY